MVKMAEAGESEYSVAFLLVVEDGALLSGAGPKTAWLHSWRLVTGVFSVESC